MHFEIDSSDLCFVDGASALILGSLASLTQPFGISDDVLRAGSVLEAAELIFESVPNPYRDHIARFLPRGVAAAAAGSVSRESHALLDLNSDRLDHDSILKALDHPCPIAFLASRGISAFGFEASYDKFYKDFDIRQIGPAGGEWSVWERCEKDWTALHVSIVEIYEGLKYHSPFAISGLDDAIEDRIKKIGLLAKPDKSNYHDPVKVIFDIFAWRAEAWRD